MPPTQSFKDIALWAWRSTRLFAFVLLGVALIIGTHLRFHRLARFDLTGDEGASWVAASAPGVMQVAKTERQFDPGKLALYDELLHGWIGVFGDSPFAMRSMSAILGTIAIALMFLTVREVCRSLGDEGAVDVGESAGAFAALLYATNLQMILSDRTVRMYPLVMCAELLQIMFFVRAQRRGGILNYVGVAIFTASMIASNFTSVFLMAAEALWLGWLLLARLWDVGSLRLAVLRPGSAVVAGIGLLMPWLPRAVASSRGAVKFGAIDWISKRPISWPYTTLHDSTGNDALFWIFVALAAFGVWRQWRSARRVLEFFAVWMAGPFIAVMAVTYLIHPLEFPRYVLIAFVGMFAIAAFGAASVRSTALRIVLAVVLISLSVRPVHDRVRHSDEVVAWSDAMLFAAQEAAPGEQIVVFPAWCINVARYYMPPERRADLVGADNQCSPARILVMSGFDLASSGEVAKMDACYPQTLAELPLTGTRTVKRCFVKQMNPDVVRASDHEV
jgi:mannosyltransferase